MPAKPGTVLRQTEETLQNIELPEGVSWIERDQKLWLLNRPGYEGGHFAAWVAYLVHEKRPAPDSFYLKPLVFPLKVAVTHDADLDVLTKQIRDAVTAVAAQFAADVAGGTARTVPEVGEIEIRGEDYVRLGSDVIPERNP